MSFALEYIINEIHRLAKRYDVENPMFIHSIVYIISNPVIVVEFDYGGYRYNGHAICNRVDRFSTIIGLSIATAMAMKKIATNECTFYIE